MIKRTLLFSLAASSCLFADFSYEQTTKMTGGAMAGMMKFAGALSKQAREPIVSNIYIKGGRMARIGPHRGEIIDVEKETIANIDFDKKQYSVMTFAEMQKSMEQMAEQMKNLRQKTGGAENAGMSFDVSAKDTGATKQISGFDTREMLLTMQMQGADKESGSKGGLDITADMWIAPKVAGYEEVAEFHRKMAKKMSWNPGASILGGMAQNNPNIAKGMAAVYKEAAKLKGMPVSEVISIGGNMMGRPAGASGPLIEMTTETVRVSTADLDAAKFEVPAGFQKVDAEAMQQRRRR